MKRWKKILLGLLIFVVAVAGAFVFFVGPWPTYSDSKFESSSYYKEALAAIDAQVRESEITPTPQTLSVGWGERNITPPIGTPLAGYGDRRGKPSTGVHDDIFVKALAISDSRDTVVLVGSDMLIVPNNIADLARAQAAAQTSLTPNDILLNASHSHCGPGAWGPGYAAYQFGGAYDEKIVNFLAEAFAGAIVDAFNALAPGKIAFGSVDAPQYIRNRSREAGVDPELSYAIAEQDDGDRCYLISYSAHPTVLGGSVMMFSGDYPGALQRYIENNAEADAVYLGGAVGSMGPKAPEAADPFERMQAMGEALAKMVLEDAQEPVFESNLDVVSVGVPITVPPMQLRINPRWRISPQLVKMLGVDRGAWIHGVRIGKTVFMGMPCDFSGELSVEMKQWAETEGVDLWCLSFCADYIGYVSPDKYYQDMYDDDGDLAYETGLMSWCGPNQGAYFTSLIKHTVKALGKP